MHSAAISIVSALGLTIKVSSEGPNSIDTWTGLEALCVPKSWDCDKVAQAAAGSENSLHSSTLPSITICFGFIARDGAKVHQSTSPFELGATSFSTSLASTSHVRHQSTSGNSSYQNETISCVRIIASPGIVSVQNAVIATVFYTTSYLDMPRL